MVVVFDLDGALVDSWEDLAASANALLTQYGGRPLSPRAVAQMVGDGARALVERAFAAAGLGAPPADALPRFLAIYDRHLLDRTRPYRGVPALLRRLAGRVRLAIVTNKPLAATRRILDGTGLARFFETVVAGDGELGRKPEPAGLQHVMRHLGTPADRTLLVGDSAIDLETARRAGTWICLARYGFGFRADAIALRGDEFLVDTPAAIEGVVARLHPSWTSA